MANITFLSNFNDQPAGPVDPGGDIPFGIITWGTPYIYEYAASSVSAYTDNFIKLAGSNRLVRPYNFDISTSHYEYHGYDITDVDGTLQSARNAASFAPYLITNSGSTPWLHNGHDKVIFTSNGGIGSSASARQIIAVDLDDNVFFSSASAAMIGSYTGAVPGALDRRIDKVVVSPDNATITAKLPINYTQSRLWKIAFNAGGFTGLTVLPDFSATNDDHLRLMASTNTKLLTAEWGTYVYTKHLRVRDIDTGALVHTIPPPLGSEWYLPLNISEQGSAVVKGSHVYFTAKDGVTESAANTRGTQLYKVNLESGTVIGQWSLKSPPVTSGFTSLAEPSAYSPVVNGLAFADDGTLLVHYVSDIQLVIGSSGTTAGSTYRERVYRATLS